MPTASPTPAPVAFAGVQSLSPSQIFAPDTIDASLRGATDNANIATVALSASSGGYTFTLAGVAPGVCTITISNGALRVPLSVVVSP